ncbi:MAG: universal stress protein [Tenacibaculum sp.]
MNKIIVPVDFSVYSERALETAAFLAKESKAEVLVVHMLELSDGVVNKSESYAQQETVFYLKLAEKRFNSFLQKEYLSDIKITPIIKHFKIFSELDQLAKEEDADLIVMGSKGTSGLKEMFIGSNTEKVIRHAHIPVLVVKEEAITQKLETAIFACDFSKDDVASYMNAKTLFEKLNCKLQLVYVNTSTSKFKSSREIDAKINSFFEMTNEERSDVKIVSDYTVEKGILYYADVCNATVITVATHGRKGISHFFNGSISEDIANHSKRPILSFKI